MHVQQSSLLDNVAKLVTCHIAWLLVTNYYPKKRNLRRISDDKNMLVLWYMHVSYGIIMYSLCILLPGSSTWASRYLFTHSFLLTGHY